MAAEKITAKSELGAAPADGDQFVIVDVSDPTEAASGTTKRINASRLARVGALNTFTANQVISANLDLLSADLGNDQAGRVIGISRNSNAGAAGPAPGVLLLVPAAGSSRRVWVDDSGDLRIHTSTPTGNTGSATVQASAGVVVGTQTSWHGAKENIEEWDGAEALDAIRALRLYSYQMISDGQTTPEGEKPVYRGLVITDEDRTNNAWFGLGYGEQQTPVLNDRNLFGYMLAAIRHGGNIINELQSQVAALTARVDALEGTE